MSALTITHTHLEGTLIDGSEKGDGVLEIARRHGFTYFPSIKRIGIRGSRDRIANHPRINGCANALRAAGWEVTVDIDDTLRDRATVVADQAARLEERAERLTAAADRHQAESDRRQKAGDAISEGIPFGQPILVGHHSQKRHERDIAKMHGHAEASWKEQKLADEYRQRAAAAGSAAAHSAKPDVTARRIKKNEAELRDVVRKLDGHKGRRHLNGRGEVLYVDNDQPPATGRYRERLTALRDQLERDLTYDREQLAAAVAEGRWTAYGPDNVHKGDTVHGKSWVSGGTVVKVNKVTVSVPSGYSWLNKIPYTDITAVTCPHEQPAEG